MKKLLESSSLSDKSLFPLNLSKIIVSAALFFCAVSFQSYGSSSNQDQEGVRKAEWLRAGAQHQQEGEEELAQVCYEAVYERENLKAIASLSLSESNIKRESDGKNEDSVFSVPHLKISDQNTKEGDDFKPTYNHKKDSYYTTFEVSSSLTQEELVHELPKYRRQKLLDCMKKRPRDGEPEKIIHNSDRRKILHEDVTNSHYNYNVYLEIYYANVKGEARIYYGSASLIAENLILTAGHNLYELKDGGYPDRIDCFVACYRDKVLAEATVFPKLHEGCVVVHPQYIEDDRRVYLSSSRENSSHAQEEKYVFSSHDIGLIILNPEQVHKIKQTWLVMNFARPIKIPSEKTRKALLKKDFVITGYPGERRAYSMDGKASMIDLEQNKICYDMDTDKGQSGSGICFLYNNQIHCAGVHACAGNDSEEFNIGVLIDDEFNVLISKYVLPQ